MKIKLSDHFTYKRLIRFMLPTVFMMIVSSIYGVINGLFVSNFVGTEPFEAIKIISPVLTAMAAFGFMMGTGGSALVAKTLGEGDKEKANQYFSMLVYIIFGVGVILSIGVVAFMRPIASALGATGEILDGCIIYGNILAFANTFLMLENCFLNYLVAAEKPNFGLVISIIAGLINVALDFLLIYIFDYGLVGAAVATSLSELIGALIPFLYFTLKKDSVLHIVKTKIDVKAILKSCGNGSSEMLTNISASVVGMLFNFQLMKLAGNDGIAAYGVIMDVHFIFLALYFGIAVGSAPVISYHFGAKNHEELKGLFKKCIVITSVTAVILTILSEILAGPIAKIYFANDEVICDMIRHAFALYSFSFLFAGYNVFGSSFFTALNDGLRSALISFLRTLVIQVAAIFALPAIFGIDGIWVAVAVAELVTLIITALLFIFNGKRYHYL